MSKPPRRDQPIESKPPSDPPVIVDDVAPAPSARGGIIIAIIMLAMLALLLALGMNTGRP